MLEEEGKCSSHALDIVEDTENLKGGSGKESHTFFRKSGEASTKPKFVRHFHFHFEKLLPSGSSGKLRKGRIEKNGGKESKHLEFVFQLPGIRTFQAPVPKLVA